jgi:hypothetical protein
MHDLSGYVFASAAMTNSLCTATCSSKGFAFAGTRVGNVCFCGNSYGRYGTADNCTTACFGDATKICGGGLANSVYKVP